MDICSYGLTQPLCTWLWYIARYCIALTQKRTHICRNGFCWFVLVDEWWTSLFHHRGIWGTSLSMVKVDFMTCWNICFHDLRIHDCRICLKNALTQYQNIINFQFIHTVLLATCWLKPVCYCINGCHYETIFKLMYIVNIKITCKWNVGMSLVKSC